MFALLLTSVFFFSPFAMHAQMVGVGGRVTAIVSHPLPPPLIDPCASFAPRAYIIGPPRPAPGLCGIWVPPTIRPGRIGAWFLGMGQLMPGLGVRILRGAFGK